ncbi:MAG TPA: hypothetical protein VMM78_19735 [Thermomicrobiales bacterium]|nr:hypothetical protein [Thermomicrobiales bacterium]
MSMHRYRRHPSDGLLRETIDAPDREPRWVAEHVQACARCQSRVVEMTGNARAARMVMAAVGDAGEPLDPAAALGRFRARSIPFRAPDGRTSGGFGMIHSWSRRVPRTVTALGAALAIVLLLSLSPMRTLADDFLNQFRVQKFAAITIPMDALAPMQAMFEMSMTDAELEAIKSELDMLGAFETTFGFEHDRMPAPMSLDEARAAYGPFLAPTDLPGGFGAEPESYVTEAGSASYTMDVERAHELVRAIGLPIFSLPDPALHPTVTFTLNAPAAVALAYTNEAGDVIVVGQMESPSLIIPDAMDMDALREDILRFPGLPADLVAELRSIDDWENTLIIPIPEGATIRDVTISGQPGLLVESPEGSVVLWEKSGILYGVGGQISGEQALDVAGSLK